MLDRRQFTFGLIATLAAPALVRAASIWIPPQMKKPFILPAGSYDCFIDEVFHVTEEGREGLVAHLRTLVPQGPWGPKQVDFNINIIPTKPNQLRQAMQDYRLPAHLKA